MLLGNEEEAWQAWLAMRATGFKLPLVAGGLADQPDALFADVLTLEGLANVIKMQMDAKKRKSKKKSDL